MGKQTLSYQAPEIRQRRPLPWRRIAAIAFTVLCFAMLVAVLLVSGLLGYERYTFSTSTQYTATNNIRRTTVNRNEVDVETVSFDVQVTGLGDSTIDRTAAKGIKNRFHGSSASRGTLSVQLQLTATSLTGWPFRQQKRCDFSGMYRLQATSGHSKVAMDGTFSDGLT
jgi:hypothetical protein